VLDERFGAAAARKGARVQRSGVGQLHCQRRAYAAELERKAGASLPAVRAFLARITKLEHVRFE
jgi:hypothetical protein